METPGSPASGRKQPMIVSLFNKLMTPTKKEEEPATRVEVQQLGEEVDKLRKIIEMHEGLMKTPLSKPQNKDGTPTQLNNNIGTNLLEKFAQSEDLTSTTTPIKSVPYTPARPTPSRITIPSTPSQLNSSLSTPSRKLSPSTPIPSTPSISSKPLSTPARTPLVIPPSTPLSSSSTSSSTTIPSTPLSSSSLSTSLPPSTPAQLVPSTPSRRLSPLSNKSSPISSDNSNSDSDTSKEELKAVDTSGETEKEEKGDQEGKENEKEVVANDADVIESLAQKILVGQAKEKEILHENKMLKGLVVKKDTEIRDLKHKVTAFEKVDNNRKEAEEQLNEMKKECEELRSILEGKDVEIKQKEDHSSALSAQIEEHYKPLEEQLNQVNNERRVLFNQVLELKGNIRVFCRVRPLTSSELANNEKSAASFPVESSIMIQNKKYDFDRVFDTSVDQAGVFHEVQPLVVSVMDGYNVCLFCYGQTGSGKTWTMEGVEGNRGVYYRALEELFRLSARSLAVKYSLSVSVLEIYNENVRDLLCSEQKKLEVRTGSNGVMVPDLTSHQITNMEEVLSLMANGAKNRAVGATNQNEHSSRSHCMVCVTVTGENVTTGVTSTARLHLVDLAGSERLSRTNAEGDRLKEAQHINKSLSALGEVVNHLVSKSAHIPYRNSKLTHLLMDCLGGDSKTLMFVHINPSEQSAPESVCSLNFAARARSVENGQAKKHNDAEYVKMREVTKKKDDAIEQLKAQLKAAEERATKAEEKYRNLALQRENAKPAPVLTEITNAAPHNFVSILRDPSTPGKHTSNMSSNNPNFSKSIALDVAKENVENGEDKLNASSRVRFAEETSKPERKRLRMEAFKEAPAASATTSSSTHSLPFRTLSRASTLRSASTKTDATSPLKSANWNSSLRGGATKPTLTSLPKRQPIRQPQRSFKI